MAETRTQRPDLIRRSSERWMGWYAAAPEDVRLEVAAAVAELDSAVSRTSPECAGLLASRALLRTRSQDSAWAMVVARLTDRVVQVHGAAERWANEAARHHGVIAEAEASGLGHVVEAARQLLAQLDGRRERWAIAVASWRELRGGWLSDAQLAGEIVTEGVSSREAA